MNHIANSKTEYNLLLFLFPFQNVNMLTCFTKRHLPHGIWHLHISHSISCGCALASMLNFSPFIRFVPAVKSRFSFLSIVHDTLLILLDIVSVFFVFVFSVFFRPCIPVIESLFNLLVICRQDSSYSLGVLPATQRFTHPAFCMWNLPASRALLDLIDQL